MKFKKINKNNAYQRGFTLIESLVAVTILITAILGPMSIAAKGIATAAYARDQAIAFFLAQEGLEYVRNVRDSNSHARVLWLSGLSACVPGACIIDSPNNTINTCAGVCPAIRYDNSTHLYGYDSTFGATNFTRTINISSTVPDEEVVVSSVVTWKSAAFLERTVVLEETLFHWQK